MIVSARAAQASAFALGALTCASAHAITIERAQTRYHEQRYELTLEATLAAPVAAVTHVVRDYERYPRLDERVQQARVLARPGPGKALLYTKLTACVSFLCRTVERVENVTELEHQLLAEAVAERSDVTFGRTQTTFQALDANTTRVIYETAVQPKFWIPRFVARRAMLNSLHNATVELFTRVEHAAQLLAGEGGAE